MADRQGAEALAPGFGRILVDAAVDFDAEMDFFRIAAVALGQFLELAEALALSRMRLVSSRFGEPFGNGAGLSEPARWAFSLFAVTWSVASWPARSLRRA